jgi:hypothetical protein
VERTQLITKRPVRLEIALKPGVWIDPQLYVKQIAGAGYAARKDEIRLTLRGRVEREENWLALVVDDVKPGPQRFTLELATSKDEKEAAAFKEAYSRLADLAGTTVEVDGWWRAATKKDGPVVLLVRSVKPG